MLIIYLEWHENMFFPPTRITQESWITLSPCTSCTSTSTSTMTRWVFIISCVVGWNDTSELCLWFTLHLSLTPLTPAPSLPPSNSLSLSLHPSPSLPRSLSDHRGPRRGQHGPKDAAGLPAPADRCSRREQSHWLVTVKPLTKTTPAEGITLRHPQEWGRETQRGWVRRVDRPDQ